MEECIRAYLVSDRAYQDRVAAIAEKQYQSVVMACHIQN
jgi:hypothetical protein